MNAGRLGVFSSIFVNFRLVSHRAIWRRGLMHTDVMTVREVAEYLKLAEKTTYRLVAEGKIPGFKVGGARCFRKADIDAWIEAKKAAARDGGRAGDH